MTPEDRKWARALASSYSMNEYPSDCEEVAIFLEDALDALEEQDREIERLRAALKGSATLIPPREYGYQPVATGALPPTVPPPRPADRPAKAEEPFVAAARSDLPDALDALEEQDREIERLRDCLREATGTFPT